MECHNHILHLRDVVYKDGMFLILKNDCNLNNSIMQKYIPNFKLVDSDYIKTIQTDEIKENLFCMRTIHSTYSHAIMDDTFAFYWAAYQDLKLGPDNCEFFITKSDVLKFPKQNLALIDNTTEPPKYRGVWHDMMTILTQKSYIFEHLYKKSCRIDNCYIYIHRDEWQRSVWNCKEHIQS